MQISQVAGATALTQHVSDSLMDSLGLRKSGVFHIYITQEELSGLLGRSGSRSRPQLETFSERTHEYRRGHIQGRKPRRFRGGGVRLLLDLDRYSRGPLRLITEAKRSLRRTRMPKESNNRTHSLPLSDWNNNARFRFRIRPISFIQVWLSGRVGRSPRRDLPTSPTFCEQERARCTTTSRS